MPTVSEGEESGELRTLTQLVLDACEELLPVLPSLIIDPFASHVLRAILLLLSPSSSTEDDRTLRSKRSSSWKAKQGSMKSVFEEKGKGKADSQKAVPPQFTEMARRFVEHLRSSLDENETRVTGANSVAGPCLKVRYTYYSVRWHYSSTCRSSWKSKLSKGWATSLALSWTESQQGSSLLTVRYLSGKRHQTV